MLAKDEILGERYRITSQLGRGGMGTVYEAEDERLGTAVALKVINVEIEKIPTEKQREFFRLAFEREARLLAGLHHEVFPRVMDYSSAAPPFLVMELVFGDNLGVSLDKNKQPFSLDKGLQWADHLLDALDYLHTQNPPIFHRDIKPENLKLSSRGRIKLLDFGIAKILDQNGSFTTNQTMVGATFDYAPIEQVLPAAPTAFREFIVLKHSEKANAVLNQKTDARCDIYAVGATFYHLLTNCVPVDSAQRSLAIWEHAQDPLPKPRTLNADIPPAISEWLLKAMEIDRENRFASALEMQTALQTALIETKRSGTTAENIIIFDESNFSSNEAENNLFSAKTVNLIESIQSQIKPAEKIIPVTNDAFNEPLSELPAGENLPIETFGTDSSESISESVMTGNNYFDTKLIAEKESETPRVSFVKPKPEAKSAFNIFWLLPIFGLILLSIGGIGAMFLLNKPDSANPATPLPRFSATTTPEILPTPTIAPDAVPNTLGEELSENTNSVSTTTEKTKAGNSAETSSPNSSDDKMSNVSIKPDKIPGPRKTPTPRPRPRLRPRPSPGFDDCLYKDCGDKLHDKTGRERPDKKGDG